VLSVLNSSAAVFEQANVGALVDVCVAFVATSIFEEVGVPRSVISEVGLEFRVVKIFSGEVGRALVVRDFEAQWLWSGRCALSLGICSLLAAGRALESGRAACKPCASP